jgi:hypothetical protein
VAEAVNSSASEAEEPRELETIVPPLARPRDSGVVYGGRFTLAYLLLVLVFGGAIAVFTYLAARPDAEQWSAWKPKGEGLARATQIANHVSPRYRQRGQQMAVVQAQPPVVENTVIDAVAIARDPSQGVGGGYISIEPATRTLLYVFCGLGAGCSMPGEASVERGQLLRRQSLELALYTFKYMDEINSVVTLLPPQGEEVPAVYLRRRALLDQLEQPLSRTLPGKAPFTTSNLTDGETVERLTAHRYLPARFQQLPNGRAMLRLGGPAPEQTQQPQTQQQQQP